MQIRQRIFKRTDMQVLHITRQNSENFDVLLAFLPLTVAKLSTLKNQCYFLAYTVRCQILTRILMSINK